MVKGLWVTEKSGHRGEEKEIRLQNVACDSEGRELRLPVKPGCRPPRPQPQPSLQSWAQPHLSCWVMSSSSLR